MDKLPTEILDEIAVYLMVMGSSVDPHTGEHSTNSLKNLKLTSRKMHDSAMIALKYYGPGFTRVDKWASPGVEPQFDQTCASLVKPVQLTLEVPLVPYDLSELSRLNNALEASALTVKELFGGMDNSVCLTMGGSFAAETLIGILQECASLCDISGTHVVVKNTENCGRLTSKRFKQMIDTLIQNRGEIPDLRSLCIEVFLGTWPNQSVIQKLLNKDGIFDKIPEWLTLVIRWEEGIRLFRDSQETKLKKGTYDILTVTKSSGTRIFSLRKNNHLGKHDVAVELTNSRLFLGQNRPEFDSW